MITKDTKKTLRRRITDKLCKDEKFLNEMIGAAIEIGGIKHTDILNTKDIRKILGLPTI
jgi:hypothetical protein